MEALDDLTYRKRRARLFNPISTPYEDLTQGLFGPYVPPPPFYKFQPPPAQPPPFKFQAPPMPPNPPPVTGAQAPPVTGAQPTPMSGPPPPPITGASRGQSDSNVRRGRQRTTPPQPPPPPPGPPVAQMPMPSFATHGAHRKGTIPGVQTSSFVALSNAQRQQNVSQGEVDAQMVRVHKMVLRGQLQREAAAAPSLGDKRNVQQQFRNLRAVPPGGQDERDARAYLKGKRDDRPPSGVAPAAAAFNY